MLRPIAGTRTVAERTDINTMINRAAAPTDQRTDRPQPARPIRAAQIALFGTVLTAARHTRNHMQNGAYRVADTQLSGHATWRGLRRSAALPGPPHPAKSSPRLGAKWEQRSAASCGQTRSDTVIMALPHLPDVQERRQAAALLACVLSSGRRGRRFKSGHPDQAKRVPQRSCRKTLGAKPKRPLVQIRPSRPGKTSPSAILQNVAGGQTGGHCLTPTWLGCG